MKRIILVVSVLAMVFFSLSVWADSTYTITASAGSGGTISSLGTYTFPAGATEAYYIDPSPGYNIADVLVDGVSVGAVSGYIFTDINANYTISATFVLAPVPVASHGPVSMNLWTVSFTDTSTNVSGTVTVKWDDGNIDYQDAGSTFTHTYVRASTYHITQSVNGAASSDTFMVSVPQTFTVSGIVTNNTCTPLSGVTMALKLDGHTRQVVRTASDGSYSLTVNPIDTYTIGLYKQGYTFDVVTVSNLTQNLTVNIYPTTVISSCVPTYTITYNGNGNTGGSVPVDPNNYVSGQTVTVLGNTGTLVQTNYSFAGWNTEADGTGTIYAQGQVFTIGTANVTLYAKWVPNVYPISVTLASGGVSSQITATTGGSLTMSGPDGTQFTLSIPPNSLTTSTVISMTPVSSLTGLPLSNGVLEAVQLGPEGLQLQIPATLTVVFASPITVPSGLSLMGFNIQDTGANFAMISPSITGGQMIFSLGHFSMAGVAEANYQEAIDFFMQQYEGFVAQMNVITSCSGSDLMQGANTAINLVKLAQIVPPPPDLELLADNALGLLQYTIQQIFQAQNTECQTSGQDTGSLVCIKVALLCDEYVFNDNDEFAENLFKSKTCGLYNISIVPTWSDLDVGGTDTFTATETDMSGNVLNARELIWQILNPSIATISDNPPLQADIQALSNGSTYINVFDEIAYAAGITTELLGYTYAQAPINVGITVKVTPSSTNLFLENGITLQAQLLDSNGDDLTKNPFTWSSSDSSIVSLSPDVGFTTNALAHDLAGKVAITATDLTTGLTGTATINVYDLNGQWDTAGNVMATVCGVDISGYSFQSAIFTMTQVGQNLTFTGTSGVLAFVFTGQFDNPSITLQSSYPVTVSSDPCEICSEIIGTCSGQVTSWNALTFSCPWYVVNPCGCICNSCIDYGPCYGIVDFTATR